MVTRTIILLAIVSYVSAHPFCANCPAQAPCPAPAQLSCPPPPQCPAQQPCSFMGMPVHTFPTLPPLSGLGNGQAPGFNGLPGFDFPTLPPHPGFEGFTPAPFGGPTLAPTLPPAPIPPSNGQEQLVPIQGQGQTAETTYTDTVVQVNQQQNFNQYGVRPTLPPPGGAPPVRIYVPPPQPAQPVVIIDQITTTTTAVPPPTLNPETYVDVESPEGAPAQGVPQQQAVVAAERAAEQIDVGGEKFTLYENEPNNGFRAPVRKALASNTKEDVLNDKCNDERLKKIIVENIDSNPSSSKRKIQKAATDQIGGLFDVICSAHDFSYLANTQLFCEAGNDDITCFAFLHSLIQ